MDTETNELQMNLRCFDKYIFRKRNYCSHVFAIKKNFENDEKACNVCFKLLEKDVKINPSIYVLWRDNAKCRVFIELHQSYVDYIFRREPIKGVSGNIYDEKLDIHLNSLLNYDWFLNYDIKESL